jgi:hypothetical protein
MWPDFVAEDGALVTICLVPECKRSLLGRD